MTTLSSSLRNCPSSTGIEAIKLDKVPLLAWCVLAVGLLAALDLTLDPLRIVKALGDTDDATRLMQVRGLLEGAPWFDTTLPLFGAPEHLVSHWSRLIDLCLASLITLFRIALPATAAETVARYVWPLMMLTPLALVLAIAARARSGQAAAYVAIGLAATCLTGLVQFMPGRIDHHNAMVLGTVAGILFVTRSIADPRFGWLAGLAFGLGTAVGYEALALTVLSLAAVSLFAVVSGRGTEGVLRTAIGFAATLFVALLLTTAPSRWLVSHCDALSLNLVILATAGAAALSIALLPGTRWSVPTRLAVLGGIGAAGAALYLLAQPACLKGPFGELDPAIGPAWLASVAETQSVFWLLTSTPGQAILFMAYAALGLAAAWRIFTLDRDDAALLSLAALAIACGLACWQIKLIPYASFLAIPAMAAVIARIPARRDISAGTLRAVTAFGLSQFTLAMFANPIGAAVVPVKKDIVDWIGTARTCLQSSTFTPLAGLPKGLFFADRDVGPFIVALSDNAVVSAPYHRMDKSILETDKIFFGPLDDAQRRLEKLGVTYVAICPGLIPASDLNAKAPGLHLDLRNGRIPGFLQPVTLDAETPLKVWRMKRGV